MRVVFRVDSSAEIATGHVSRCLALAEALRADGADCSFVSRELAGASHARIVSAGFALATFPAAAAGSDFGIAPDDAARTGEHLGGSPVDWLVVDHYGIDGRWAAGLRDRVGRILVIDDLADRDHDADLLVDSAARDGDYDDRVPPTCRRLLGPRYALLRAEFAAARDRALARRERTAGRVERVLVGYGGVDDAGLTSAALAAWERLAPDGVRVEVLVGAATPGRSAIEACAAGRTDVSVVVAATDVAERMARADLALGAGGGMSWERCTLGLPALVTRAAPNQRAVVARLVEAGAAVEAGADRGGSLEAELGALLADAGRVREMAHAAAALCDGRGAVRVATAMRSKNGGRSG